MFAFFDDSDVIQQKCTGGQNEQLKWTIGQSYGMCNHDNQVNKNTKLQRHRGRHQTLERHHCKIVVTKEILKKPLAIRS